MTFVTCSGGQDKNLFAETTLERDHFKSPEESKEFGLIDEVVSKRNVAALADQQQSSSQGSGLWS